LTFHAGFLREGEVSLSGLSYWSAAGRLRQFFGNAQSVGAALHLRIHVGRIDAGAPPEHDEVIEEIRAFAHDTCAAALHGFQRDLAGLLDDLLCRAAA
jgi:hypothetical protein